MDIKTFPETKKRCRVIQVVTGFYYIYPRLLEVTNNHPKKITKNLPECISFRKVFLFGVWMLTDAYKYDLH